MSAPTTEQRQTERILVLAPTRGDADLCRRFLDAARLASEICETDTAICDALKQPAAVLVVAEESLHGPAGACIRDHLAEQPEWSAMPIIILVGRGAAHRRLGTLEDYDVYGRITLLERPVRMAAFIGTLRLALRERRQQYRVRDLLAERAERISQRDEFLAMLGHELRNPLAAVLICGDVLEAAPPDSSQAGQCRRVITTQARQIKRLLDDLSDVSRINRRKLSLEREPTDLRGVLEDAVSQVLGEINARRQTLELDLDPQAVPLLADPMRLRQVFANLLTNANRYSADGGHIWLHLAIGDGLARVSIRDDGVGLSADALTRIFEPFYQDRGAGGPRAGLGIGLALARSLVEMHAGNISVHSAGPGCGSEFVVTLPLHEGTDLPASPAPSIRSAPLGRPEPRRILLIEDNREFAGGLKQLLEARGHSVDLAHDGAQALRVAHDSHPDVVLLDIGLPGLDGYEVARRLRRVSGLSGVRVIAVTGFGRVTDKQRCRRAGIDRYLVKPVGLPELEAAMAE